jgi:hypothetical protein
VLVESGGTLNATASGFFGNGTGVQVNSGGSATVTGSAFETNTTAARHIGTNAANANFAGNWWATQRAARPSVADGVINSNPAGQPVSDNLSYGGFLASRPVFLSAHGNQHHSRPRKLACAVGGCHLFAAINLATLTAGDVRISGPAAAAV